MNNYIHRIISVFSNLIRLGDTMNNVKIGKYSKLYHKYALSNVSIGNFSYVGRNSYIDNTLIGNFCSIGPNFTCGLGIHPLGGISTSPCFYSNKKQCGYTFSNENKIRESKQITIGHDVFIGANVTILAGVSIGNGAVIGAGAVVTKDIPPYAIVGGCPANIIRFRFDPEIIDRLMVIEWWTWENDKLPEVEAYFESPLNFVEKYYKA